MSGETEKEERRAFLAGDKRHVAMCLAQGGFARIVPLVGGGVLHVNLHGRQYRHDPNGLPPPPSEERGEPEADVPAKPPLRLLPAIEPLVTRRLVVDGVRFGRELVWALQHLIAAGGQGVSAGQIKIALKTTSSTAKYLLRTLSSYGLALKGERSPDTGWEYPYTPTPAGVAKLSRLERELRGEVLADREAALLGALERRSMRVQRIAKRMGLPMNAVRDQLAKGKARGLVTHARRGRSFYWSATPKGRKELASRSQPGS